ncbi:MAG: hypothetical protein KME13_21555 [Myxacorys californica WJT36-NPBG1]|jgi:hypothetical protein|nr:hypothetical protein [Myxacorys californica WJT36-NPBG1]
MTRTLTLSIDAFSLALGDRTSSRFAQGGYERILGETGTTEYSLFGNAISDGSLFEAKFVWTIQTYLGVEQWRVLWAIFARAERHRRNQEDSRIYLSDTIQHYVEDEIAPTRQAAGPITTIAGGGIAYPAVFAVRMFEPKAEETGSLQYRYLARFVLKELDRVVA